MSLQNDFSSILKQKIPVLYNELIRSIDYRKYPHEFMLISGIILYSSEETYRKYQKLNIVIKNIINNDNNFVNIYLLYNLIISHIKSQPIKTELFPENIPDEILETGDITKAYILILNMAIKVFDTSIIRTIDCELIHLILKEISVFEKFRMKSNTKININYF